jgi:hypothetical protein
MRDRSEGVTAWIPASSRESSRVRFAYPRCDVRRYMPGQYNTRVRNVPGIRASSSRTCATCSVVAVTSMTT